jgi:HSP20 family protein
MLLRWRDYNRSFAALDELRRQMNAMFEESDRPWSSLGERGSTFSWPPTNLYDAGSELILVAATPGLDEKAIRLDLMGETLTLSGLRKADGPEGYSVHRQERGEIRFSRSFSLPCKVENEKVRATMKDGILTVTLSKAPEAKPRQITVKAG